MAFTYFFRDRQVLDLITEHVIPDLKTRRYMNVWDAGCAWGPEPYSIAITFRENMGHFLFRNVRIFATDIDESGSFGERIAAGLFAEIEINRIPPETLASYFAPAEEAGHYRISDELRRAVRFQRHNLLSLQPIREEFGLIVCKNVLLHFTPEERVEVIKMFYGALSEGGYLVTEQTQKLPPEVNHLFSPVTRAGQVLQKVPAASLEPTPG